MEFHIANETAHWATQVCVTDPNENSIAAHMALRGLMGAGLRDRLCRPHNQRLKRIVDILLAILGWYVLAKVLELGDKVIYSANGVVSGHTLKHVVASLGALWIVFLLQKRYAGGADNAAQQPSA